MKPAVGKGIPPGLIRWINDSHPPHAIRSRPPFSSGRNNPDARLPARPSKVEVNLGIFMTTMPNLLIAFCGRLGKIPEKCRRWIFFSLTFFPCLIPAFAADPVAWGKAVVINDTSNFPDQGKDARGINPGKFGSQYGRMTKLAGGNWLIVYTIYDNNGYQFADSHELTGQGTALQVARSADNCRTWRVISTLRANNRDLDNGEILQLPNGQLRMAARSVRWQESYRIGIWSSIDGGATWQSLSHVDGNEGFPGSLGHPDKGVYEPFLQLLADGTLAVLYASEKHVTGNPSYSQIVSEKLSSDGGQNWGDEIWVAWDPKKPSDRPGMPVIAKMANGQYLAAFEVVGSQHADIFCKSSPDGKSWTPGLGTVVPGQAGGPYIISLADGRLVMTSNTGNVSFSDNDGATWRLNDRPAWGDGTINTYWWLSVYQTGPQEIGVVASVPRPSGGTQVQIKFGKLSAPAPKSQTAAVP
jgi:hypothetical protein